MWRWMTVVSACAAGAAVGATVPWVWYYGPRDAGDWDSFALEIAGPPGLGTTLLWAILGAGVVLALRGDRP